MNTAETLLSSKQEKAIIKAIQEAEKNTSGEIRIHLENHTKKPPLERAKEVFFRLKMDQTQDRNGVLFYIGVSDKKFAILGDEGINKQVPDNFWEEETSLVTQLFAQDKFTEGLIEGVLKAGEKLKEFFPYQSDDKNELSDEISKG